jgi:hypothetical protein
LRCGLTPEKASVMKFAERNPFADPDAAARKLVEIANGVEAVAGWSCLYRARQRAVSAGGSGTSSAPGSPAPLRWGGDDDLIRSSALFFGSRDSRPQPQPLLT